MIQRELHGSAVTAALLRRELAEQRLLFVYVPLAGVLMYFVWALSRMQDFASTQFARGLGAAEPGVIAPERLVFLQALFRSNFVRSGHEAFAGVLQMAFWASMAFYFLYTLYQQRRDRSILFWNSMPVSDAQTVVSKLLAGLVGCHAIYLLLILLSELLTPALVWVYSAVLGTNAWDPYLQDAWRFARMPEYLGMMPINILWSLPVYGWLLLVSAWSRQAPFAWATGPWLLIVIVELALREKSWLFDATLSRLFPSGYFGSVSGMGLAELVLGALLGAVFIYGAIRVNRSDDT